MCVFTRILLVASFVPLIVSLLAGLHILCVTFNRPIK